MTTALVKYEAACRALAECKSVDEVKTWSDKAAAMQAYGRMAKDKRLEVDAAEIRIRAERRLGEMLLAQKADGGLNRGALKQGPALVANEDGKQPPKLADAGIGYDLSSRAQKLAAVPEEKFETELDDWRERVQAEGARVTARLQAAGAKAMAAPESDIAHDQSDPDAPDLPALVAELSARNDHLEALVHTLQTSDAHAEVVRLTDALQGSETRRNALQSQVSDMDRALRKFGRQWAELRALCGVQDNAEVLAAVRAAFKPEEAET